MKARATLGSRMERSLQRISQLGEDIVAIVG